VGAAYVGSDRLDLSDTLFRCRRDINKDANYSVV
jgi:hypothetical protein